jgi:hypothetical protein
MIQIQTWIHGRSPVKTCKKQTNQKKPNNKGSANLGTPTENDPNTNRKTRNISKENKKQHSQQRVFPLHFHRLSESTTPETMIPVLS